MFICHSASHIQYNIRKLELNENKNYYFQAALSVYVAFIEKKTEKQISCHYFSHFALFCARCFLIMNHVRTCRHFCYCCKIPPSFCPDLLQKDLVICTLKCCNAQQNSDAYSMKSILKIFVCRINFFFVLPKYFWIHSMPLTKTWKLNMYLKGFREETDKYWGHYKLD